MTRRYTGGFLSATEQATDANTSNGIYTLQEAGQATAVGNFPTGGWTPSRSLRFRRSASSYLNRTAGTPTDGKKATFSFWIKKADLSLDTSESYRSIFYCGTPNSDGLRIAFARYDGYNNHEFVITQDNGSSAAHVTLFSTQSFRDPAAWYHFLIRYDSTDTVANNRARMFVNGNEITSFSNRTNPSLNHIPTWQVSGTNLKIGRGRDDVNEHYDMYLSEVNFIDGQALTPSAFGQTDAATGQWEPKRYTGTYGNNGYYLDFRDNSAATASTLGADRSGNGNNFTPNNFSLTAGTTYDSMVDVPGIASVSNQIDVGGVQRGNYPTLNPLFPGGYTLTEGNLYASGSAAITVATMGIPPGSGKFYWEATQVNTTNQNNNIPVIGMTRIDSRKIAHDSAGLAGSRNLTWYTDSVFRFESWVENGVTISQRTASFNGCAAGDVVMFCYDSNTGKWWYGKNGSWADGLGGTTGSPSTGYGPVFTIPTDSTMAPFLDHAGTNADFRYNFGQRAFAYAPPTGFKSICSTNLPNPVIKRPEQHFGVRTWVGNGSNLTLGVTAKESSAYPIERSLKFNASTSGHLTRTPASASNRRTWTYSAWIKRSVLGTRQSIFSAGTGNLSSAPGGGAYFTSSTNKIEYIMGGGTSCAVTTDRPFTDTTAWMHLVIAMDTTQVAPAQRLKMYVDGVQITGFSSTTYPSQNFETDVNNAVIHAIGSRTDDGALPNTVANYYLAEVNFIDGSAKIPSDFGAYDANNNWMPQRYTGTYGTNGFYLPMKQSGATSGFNTVTFTPKAGVNKISGVGFNPDLVWMKRRNSSQDHFLIDSVRGGGTLLRGNQVSVESTSSSPAWITSFDADGFTSHSDSLLSVGVQYVAWCWDAGDTTVSNTAGTITSQVRANTTNGFSIVTWTGNSSAAATVGHGLGAVPAMIICKERNGTDYWHIKHKNMATTVNAYFNTTENYTAAQVGDGMLGDLNSSTTFGFVTAGSPGNVVAVNETGINNIAYCFAEIAGFSKFGTYTGTGAAGNTQTTGFRPALIMIKRMDAAGEWYMWDGTRGERAFYLKAGSADYESDIGHYITFTDTGFTFTGNYGNNLSGATYVYAVFADNRANVFWKDNSGNSNSWLPSQGVATSGDVVLDAPADIVDASGNIAGNYPIMAPNSNYTLTDGGLSIYRTGATQSYVLGSIPISYGKFYWEVSVNTLASNYPRIGIAGSDAEQFNNYPGGNSGTSARVWAGAGGSNLAGISPTTTGALFGTGGSNSTNVTFTGFYSQSDIVMFALDKDNNKLWVGKNGTWYTDTSTTTTSAAIADNTAAAAFSDLGMINEVYPAIFCNQNADRFTMNFGQLPFVYSPPTGFKSINSKNLKDFGSYNLPDSFGNFVTTPDLAWMKSRTNGSYRHQWVDTVRGPRNVLFSSDNTEQQTFESVQSFIPNGVTLGPEAGTNETGGSHAGWFWNRGKTPGFDIVTYGGNGVNGRMIPHNLGQEPAFYITKCLTTYNNTQSFTDWSVYHKDCPTYTGNSRQGKQALWLHRDLAAANGVGGFFNTATSAEFSPNQINYDNSAGQSYVAYLWAQVPGFSQFGSYVGNGSTNGPFVYTGFKPAFILTKNITTAGYWWEMVDNKRSPFNPSNKTLYANVTDTEYTSSGYNKDLLSNGFKMRGNSAGHNSSGDTFVYAAFAENPFKYGNAR